MSIATDKSIPTYGEVKTLISNNHNIIIRKLSNYNIRPNSSLETVINELNDVNINKDASWFSISMFGIPDGSGIEDAESAYYTSSFALLGLPILGYKYLYGEYSQSAIMCNISNKGFTIFSIKLLDSVGFDNSLTVLIQLHLKYN